MTQVQAKPCLSSSTVIKQSRMKHSSDKEDDIVRHHDLVVVLHLVQRGPQLGVRELNTWVVHIHLLTHLVHRQRVLVLLLEQLEQRRLERLQSTQTLAATQCKCLQLSKFSSRTPKTLKIHDNPQDHNELIQKVKEKCRKMKCSKKHKVHTR